MGMGYQRKSYVLKWPEGHVHHGLVVKLRGLSIDDFGIVSSMRGIKKEEDLKPEVFAAVLEVLSSKIIEWNLQDGDEVIPHDVNTLRGEDFSMILDIINSWITSVTAVSRPLGANSTSANTFTEESIPMETSSPSPTS
jgi:hypothetical protein